MSAFTPNTMRRSTIVFLERAVALVVGLVIDGYASFAFFDQLTARQVPASQAGLAAVAVFGSILTVWAKYGVSKIK